LIASAGFGWYGPAIFGVDMNMLSKPQRIAQHWLNFVGAVTGWAALYFGASRLWARAELGIWDAVAMLIAFFGHYRVSPLCHFAGGANDATEDRPSTTEDQHRMKISEALIFQKRPSATLSWHRSLDSPLPNVCTPRAP
jgi:hypothetical protein